MKHDADNYDRAAMIAHVTATMPGLTTAGLRELTIALDDIAWRHARDLSSGTLAAEQRARDNEAWRPCRSRVLGTPYEARPCARDYEIRRPGGEQATLLTASFFRDTFEFTDRSPDGPGDAPWMPLPDEMPARPWETQQAPPLPASAAIARATVAAAPMVTDDRPFAIDLEGTRSATFNPPLMSLACPPIDPEDAGERCPRAHLSEHDRAELGIRTHLSHHDREELERGRVDHMAAYRREESQRRWRS